MSEDTQGRKSRNSDLADREREEALKNLEILAAGRVTEDRIKQEGTELILPESMTIGDARRFLRDHEEQQEKTISFTRILDYRPWDGAHALQQTMFEVFGTRGIGVNTMFSRAERKTINIGVGETTQVPWGTLTVPQFEDAVFELHALQDEEKGLLFAVAVNVKRKYEVAMEGFFQRLEHELQTNSIYRGKAFDGRRDPEFLDTESVDPDKIVYNNETLTQLEANVWSQLRYTDVFREKGESLKRAILLEGPYGTGKTLGASVTAKVAVENGWTYIYCRPKDNLREVMSMARLYQPAVVLCEDIDTQAAGEEGRDRMSEVLDIFDGLSAKNNEIMVILTTNHVQRLHKGMLRPGRLDAVIHIGELEAEAVVDLIHATTPEGMLSEDVDYTAVGEAFSGFLPAFVKEAVSRATRFAISRNGGKPTKLTTRDLVAAAASLRPQLELMSEALDAPKVDPLSEVLKDVVAEATIGVTERTRIESHYMEETMEPVVVSEAEAKDSK